jgi:hypothetical protein
VGRHATRYNNRDANERTLLDVAAHMGVEFLEAPPLDGWVFIQRFIPVEIKNPDGKAKPGRKGEFRESQETFIERCKRNGWPYLIWRTTGDVINSINALRRTAR